MICDAIEPFDEFMRRRETASNDYIRGDARSIAEILTNQDPATFMPPNGSVVEQASAVASAQIDGAAAFGPRSSGHFEILNSGSSGDLAFWTGRQVAQMDVAGHHETISMVLRTTEVFRREHGHWKLVHRHADIPTPTKQ